MKVSINRFSIMQGDGQGVPQSGCCSLQGKVPPSFKMFFRDDKDPKPEERTELPDNYGVKRSVIY